MVHSNLLISLSAASVAVTTVVLADLPLRLLPVCIVFAVTLFVYSFNRLADLDEDERNVPGRAAFTRRYGPVLFALGVACYLAVFVLAVVWDLPGAPLLVVPFVVAILYSTVGLKRLFLVKNLTVGVAWGLIPLGVGVYYDALGSTEIRFLFGFVTAVLTIAAVVFDVKDIEGDRAEGIRTVPNTFGPRATRIATAAATVVVSVVVLGFVLAGVLGRGFLVLLAFTAYVFGYCLAATPDRGPLFYGFVVDGEHVFLAALVLVLDATAW
nr:UbiA family prenyltransferase [Salinilacihabitans rarus]